MVVEVTSSGDGASLTRGGTLCLGGLFSSVLPPSMLLRKVTPPALFPHRAVFLRIFSRCPWLLRLGFLTFAPRLVHARSQSVFSRSPLNSTYSPTYTSDARSHSGPSQKICAENAPLFQRKKTPCSDFLRMPLNNRYYLVLGSVSFGLPLLPPCLPQNHRSVPFPGGSRPPHKPHAAPKANRPPVHPEFTTPLGFGERPPLFGIPFSAGIVPHPYSRVTTPHKLWPSVTSE